MNGAKLVLKGDRSRGNNLRMLTLIAAVAMTFGVATPALATEQADCSTGSASVKIHWTDGSGAARTNCYGGVGALEVGLPRSSSVEAGRNHGWVETTDSAGMTIRRFFSAGEVIPTGFQTLTKIYVG
ncbi:hypothetical protein [Lentzea aerocolonigenes]|uniref:hypothetical protein n=1 Tax=Lentzea aerocolonigenes TaxID=68170 RepID=UPI0012DC2662|nr:hypothetical protein [Lentzea aerocolonigenes]